VARHPDIHIRDTVMEDAPHLTKWLTDPLILRWFPMFDEREIEDAVRIWISYSKIGACITADWNGIPCGMANLYIQPYKKLAHQCLFSIIVDEKYRNKGIGTALLEDLMALGKQRFRLEVLHLEVYEGNPAIHLYSRLGFKEFGKQTHFIKDKGEYIGKILMERAL
jgi:RimJ/RimL family protein N-acetyltransferase